MIQWFTHRNDSENEISFIITLKWHQHEFLYSCIGSSEHSRRIFPASNKIMVNSRIVNFHSDSTINPIEFQSLNTFSKGSFYNNHISNAVHSVQFNLQCDCEPTILCHTYVSHCKQLQLVKITITEMISLKFKGNK